MMYDVLGKSAHSSEEIGGKWKMLPIASIHNFLDICIIFDAMTFSDNGITRNKGFDIALCRGWGIPNG